MAAVLKPALPEPTREQLQLAYRHMARPGWPDTLDAALRIHGHRVAIYGLARSLGRADVARTAYRHTLPRGPVPPTPTQADLQHATRRPTGSIANARPVTAWPKQTPGAHDCKRAAANDKD